MELITLDYPHHFLNKEKLPPLSMALGYFDGLHLGHQSVIKEALDNAKEKGLKSAVMTFDPHPSVVLGKSVRHVEYISPLKDKIKLISDMGVDYLFIVHFTADFAGLVPQEFVDQYLIGLNVKHVVAGFDYTYGRMGQGTMETIPFHSRGAFSYSVVPKLAKDGMKISSTAIRSLILEGAMNQLPEFLGRFYRTEGIVIHGDKRGRTIGFPTANIAMSDQYLIPPPGVYAVKIEVAEKQYNGVCNIGFKPTFNREASEKPSIEVHIFDFDQMIYGETLKVEWHFYIRGEKRFSGIEELKSQIERDKETAISYFEKNNA